MSTLSEGMNCCSDFWSPGRCKGELPNAQGLWSTQEENRKQPGCDLAHWGQCYCCTPAHFGSVLKWYVSIIALVQKQEIINQRLSRGRVWAELTQTPIPPRDTIPNFKGPMNVCAQKLHGQLEWGGHKRDSSKLQMSGIPASPLGMLTCPEQSHQEHNPTHQPGGISSFKTTTLLLPPFPKTPRTYSS